MMVPTKIHCPIHRNHIINLEACVSSIYFLARSGNTLARWTPQSARHALGASIGAASYFGWPSKRSVTRLNMAQITGRPAHDPYVKRLALASWRNYGRYASDFISFPHLDVDHVVRNLRDLSESEGGWQGCMQSALLAGRGAYLLLLTLATGTWPVLFLPTFTQSQQWQKPLVTNNSTNFYRINAERKVSESFRWGVLRGPFCVSCNRTSLPQLLLIVLWQKIMGQK